MKLKYELAVQEVSGSYMAVAINDDAKRYKNIINLNKTGAYIINELKNETTIENLIETLYIKYKVDKETLNKEVPLFIQGLEKEGLIIK